jgi:hypothetical protein
MAALLACVASHSLDPADTGVSSGGGDTSVEQVVGDGEPDDTGDPVEAEFFDDAFLHQIDLTLSDDAVEAIKDDPYTYVDAAVTVDGAVFEHVGVRLRGKIGSFRRLSGKPKFKLDFNRFVSDQRLGSYETLALNNEVVDCSYLREPTGYALFRQLGLPAPRTVFTAVTLNGEDYGLYVVVEFPDDTFLRMNYADGTGNLYDGKYLWGGGWNYTMIDFTASQVDGFQLEEGTDVERADVRAISDALEGDGTFDERVGALIDTQQFHRHLVGEQWIGHLDGYALNTNNYRVYFDPGDGLADFLVYDLDYAFLTASSWGFSWGRPSGVLAQVCWRDEACAAEHAQAVTDGLAMIDSDALLASYDAWLALIGSAAEADPRRECGYQTVVSEQAAVRAWIEGGSATLESFWAK